MIELDVFSGKNAGLVLFEIECEHENELDNLVLPDWAQGAEDVTNNPSYKN